MDHTDSFRSEFMIFAMVAIAISSIYILILLRFSLNGETITKSIIATFAKIS